LGVDESKIELIYDWVEIDNKEKAPRNNSFSSQYDLDDTFNIVYAGNMGVVQGLETIIDTANILREDTRIRFIFIGDGAAKPNLIEKVRQLLLSNIIFVPYQPRDKMPEIWASADAALVILRKEAGFYALPSKTFSILANALPIIACIDYGSDTWDLVQRSESGLCVPPEDPAALAQAILSLKGDLVRSKQMGQNGRAWAEKYHSPQAAATHFESLFQSILGTKE
jgi:colanic acid biosynthesis glycosyl transferase WcaI